MLRPGMLVVAACFAGCAFSEPEVHLIQSGFQGDVYIIPRMPRGDAPEREGAAIVFRIPPTGILVTQDAPSGEWHVASYYRVGPDNRRQVLEVVPSTIHDTPANRADVRPIIWFPRSGSMSGIDIPCTVEYQQYYVGSRASLLARGGVEGEARFRTFVRENHVCR